MTFDRDFLKTKSYKEQVNIMLFDFPLLTPEEIVPFLDDAVEAIKKLKRKKKPFVAIYSQQGLEIVKEYQKD